MQLTRYTDYGFRTLIYLALLPEEQLASIDAISEAYDISRNNVNKIVHHLGKEQLIATKRGKGGGFKLAKPASEINIGETLEILEASLNVIECHKPYCAILPACRLKEMFAKATQAFIDELKAHTLADVISDREAPLATILKVSP